MNSSALLIRILGVVAVALIGLAIGAHGALASPAFIDEFAVIKNGATIFTDPFGDGVPPPSAPAFTNGTPASYFVFGTLDEAAGRVRLDTTGANLTTFAGREFFVERALLLTNINPSDLALGLKNDDTFSVTGRYDLTVPGALREFYGIRVNDGTPANQLPDDTLHLGVRRGADGVDRVQFFRLDFVTQTFTSIASALLEAGHDQIFLDLARTSTSSDAVTASFAYVDGGVAGPVTTFGTTADIFHGENFTRAEFLFFTPVLEPSTWLLLGPGLIGAGALLWRSPNLTRTGHHSRR
jgi:hypothetical protein